MSPWVAWTSPWFPRELSAAAGRRGGTVAAERREGLELPTPHWEEPGTEKTAYSPSLTGHFFLWQRAPALETLRAGSPRQGRRQLSPCSGPCVPGRPQGLGARLSSGAVIPSEPGSQTGSRSPPRSVLWRKGPSQLLQLDLDPHHQKGLTQPTGPAVWQGRQRTPIGLPRPHSERLASCRPAPLRSCVSV